MRYLNKPLFGNILDKGNSLSRKLVGCWLFNEDCGPRVLDLSGNNNRGTLMVNTNFVPCRFGNGLIFDGVSYVRVLNSPSIDITDVITMLAWIYPTSEGTSRNIVDKSWGRYGFYLDGADDRFIIVYQNELGVGVPFPTNAFPPMNEWHQLVAVIDSIGNFVGGYHNGKFVGSGAFNGISIRSTTGNLFFSCRGTGGDNFFTGRIDHVMIWNRALSAIEIAELYCEQFSMIKQKNLYRYIA